MEMWRHRTPMMRKRTLKNGRPTTAMVHFCPIGTDGQGDCPRDAVTGAIAVEVPGGAPVVRRGRFDGHGSVAPFVTPGTRLPVALQQARCDQSVADLKRATGC